MSLLLFNVPFMTWMRLITSANVHAQIVTFVGFFVIAWIQSGCTSFLMQRLTYFLSSQPNINICFITPYHLFPLTFCTWNSFVHCIRFCRCFLFSNGFFRGILSFRPTYVNLLTVFTLTKITVALSSFLIATNDTFLFLSQIIFFFSYQQLLFTFSGLFLLWFV